MMSLGAELTRPLGQTRSQSSLTKVIREELTPLVTRIDDGHYPEAVLRRLGRAGAYAHHQDGSAEGLVAAIEDTAQTAAACLSTAFCVWCQNALVWYLARSGKDSLAPRLASLSEGRVLGGTGLSNPMKAFSGIEPLALSGTREPGGYRVRGRLPWVSNLGPGHPFAVIFNLADGRRVMAVIEAGSESVSIASNARFCALEGTGTYTVMVREAFVPDEAVIADDAAAFVPGIRNGFVLLQAGMALGLARGVADLMRSDARGRRAASALPLDPNAIDGRAAALTERVTALADYHEDESRTAFLEILRLRLDLSWLALDAAQAAMLQFGARGYLAKSDAFRRLREAQFVAIVTPSVKHITTELARVSG